MTEERPTVVLLHGLARTARSMSRLERRIAAAGFPTWSWTYPSRRLPIEALGDAVAERIQADLGDRAIVGVTHSLGGIIARHVGSRANWRGVVMLAPPNDGSHIARRLAGQPLFRWYFGPAGQDVADGSTWPTLGPVAVIAGTGGASVRNPPSLLTSALSLFPEGEPHDGTVLVRETRLPEMADFATVDATHTWIMNHPETTDLVLRFLTQGSFGSR